MDWHEAYLAQARSDHSVLRRLDDPKVEYCHRPHYVQMHQVRVPAEYDFPEFDPKDPKMIKIDRLIEDLLRIG